MAPKNKFTKEEMVAAALQVVRTKGIEGLTAKTMADALGTSTQPIFTAFGSMDTVRQEVCAAAVRVYDRYTNAGLQEKIPFFGVGMQYIRFRPTLMEIYQITELEADLYFCDLWFVVHSLSTLIVTGDCPYSDQEIGQVLTGVSISICKSIKEITGFAAGTFDRDAAFRALVGKGPRVQEDD